MQYKRTLLTRPMTLVGHTHGEGMPVVLLHGFPLSHLIWRHQREALSLTSRVITVDLRGHGSSPAPEGAYPMDLMARDVLQTLDHLRVERAVWVGHSMGGYITMAAWRLAPERFAGMGLVATHHLADTEEVRRGRYKLAEKVAKEGSEAAVNPDLFAERTPRDAYYVPMTWEIIRDTPPNGIIGALLGMASRPDSSETLRAVNVPTTVIGGLDDRIIPGQRVRDMAALIPDSRLMMLSGAGHMPMLEQPDATSRALTDLVLRAAQSGAF